jgi:hypothetical protein
LNKKQNSFKVSKYYENEDKISILFCCASCLIHAHIYSSYFEKRDKDTGPACFERERGWTYDMFCFVIVFSLSLILVLNCWTINPLVEGLEESNININKYVKQGANKLNKFARNFFCLQFV